MPLVAALATGCYTEADVGYRAGYVAAAPAMVEVGPGVMVISDYDYPVFYTGGLYYRQYGGVWYSSSVYTGGWALAYNTPYAVASIREPGAYVHYRGGYGTYGGPAYRGGATYNAGATYNGGAAVRDHRTYSAPASTPVYRAAPAARGPAVRDHRR